MSEQEPLSPEIIPSQDLPPAPPARDPNWIWIGPDGLRAGWGIAIYIILVVALGLAVTSVVRLATKHSNSSKAAVTSGAATVQTSKPDPAAQPKTAVPSSAKTDILQEGSILLIVLLATWIMSKIEKRPFGQYGLGGNSRRWPQFFQGLLWGFATLSALIGMLYLGHYIVFDGRLLNGAHIFKYAIVWLLFFGMVGMFEEFFFRGYIQFTLARGIGRPAWGFFIAAALFNFGFGFAHSSNPGESPIGVFLAGFIGFIFCLSLWYTRSLWWAIGFHTTWDWAESYFYGTADSGTLINGHLYATHPQGSALMSGGATGPEGSVFAIIACLLTALIIWGTLRNERSKSTNQALVNPPDLGRS
jgi:uncharacterized protein